MAQALTECFEERTRIPRDFAFSFEVGGAWFCPGCGVQAHETEGRIVCPRCSRSLNEFIHSLVDLHPHRLDEATEALLERHQTERRKAPVWRRPAEERGDA
jgi:hypothetical protein